MKFIFPVILFFMFSVSSAQKKQFMLVGTYTSGKSTGIHVYSFNSKSGTSQLVDSIKTSNPSYLAISPSKKFVYAVNEDAEKGVGGKVTAFSFNKQTGRLVQLNQQRSMGDHPCYISVDKTGKWVFVGNYSSGTAAVLPVRKDGSLGEAVNVLQHEGSGVNKERQEGPHVHATVLSPDNRTLFVTDLGIDKIMLYSFNEKNGSLRPKTIPAVKLADGSGPRHLDFHPNGKWAYLVQEMAGTITAFSYKNGSLHAFQTISTLPAGFSQSFSSADIHVSPDGKFLYASNRDSVNDIVIYKIEPSTGRLRLTGHQSTLGKTPRNFSFDPTGTFLLVANQRSDDIIIFRRNAQSGLLRDTGKRIDIGNPVCIKWIE
jgi:6-phosphogluconolactonase